jgi:hypothetical protein
MADGFLMVAGILAGTAVMVVSVFRRSRRDTSAAGARLRRGTGHALLGLQQFIEPSVEHVFEAQNVEQKDDEGDDGLGDDEAVIRSDLADALGRASIDVEEVRRHLASAARAGLDWRAIYEAAVADELSDRPFRAPSIPSSGRVRPCE